MGDDDSSGWSSSTDGMSSADVKDALKWQGSKGQKATSAASTGIEAASKSMPAAADRLQQENRGVASFRKGGRVRKTGLIHAHKNEEVVRPEQADKVRRFLKKTKGRSDEAMDDPKRTARKGDPERVGKKEEPARTTKKHDPKKTFSRNAPKRMSAKRKGKRSKGRDM